MIEVKERKTKKNTINIYMGEKYVSRRDELIYTAVGTCICICLHDDKNKISGMNHYMLPGMKHEMDYENCNKNQYGLESIRNLIDDMMNVGAVKQYLSAKIFGGASLIEELDAGRENVKLAKIMLEFEDINIVVDETGKNYTRKILMDVLSGKVFVKNKHKAGGYGKN